MEKALRRDRRFKVGPLDVNLAPHAVISVEVIQNQIDRFTVPVWDDRRYPGHTHSSLDTQHLSKLAGPS